jgi:hypothetical protein
VIRPNLFSLFMSGYTGDLVTQRGVLLKDVILGEALHQNLAAQESLLNFA